MTNYVLVVLFFTFCKISVASWLWLRDCDQADVTSHHNSHTDICTEQDNQSFKTGKGLCIIYAELDYEMDSLGLDNNNKELKLWSWDKGPKIHIRNHNDSLFK